MKMKKSVEWRVDANDANYVNACRDYRKTFSFWVECPGRKVAVDCLSRELTERLVKELQDELDKE